MKKFILSMVVFVASAAYVVYQNVGGGSTSATLAAAPVQQASSAPVATQQTSTATPVQTSGQTQTSQPAPTPTPTPQPRGQYTDGTYTGNAANAYYGYVQVEAVIQGGKITAVNFLQHPNDRQTSQYINDQAMPLLQQEAIQAQSADVSGVSGATDTSMAFRESLGNALAQAKA